MMEDNESARLHADSSLPRPVVLRPEDLASVAAAGASMAMTPALTAKVLIAGGISVDGGLARGVALN